MRNFRPGVVALAVGLLVAFVCLYFLSNRRSAAFVDDPSLRWEQKLLPKVGDVDRKDYLGNKTFVLNPVESILDAPCRRNTGPLVQRMRETQREINRMFQRTVENATARYELLPGFFRSAMDGFRYALRPFKYWSQDEYKHFLEFSDPNAPCNHITFGVGGSWDGEKALRRKYPQCKMTGVDPTEALSRAVVESDPNSRFVHAAISDVPEKRAELPVICQWNVEIHYAEERYGVTWTEFDRTLNQMLDEAYWVLLNVDQRLRVYRRLFFFNVGAEECISKFLC
ncbi:hypothetical protein M3Y99_00749900 [Aphelenchoides fujianensis]|nr:hypothetical protein M3Y99_00749900 [Aphelenchoides fujianensis]